MAEIKYKYDQSRALMMPQSLVLTQDFAVDLGCSRITFSRNSVSVGSLWAEKDRLCCDGL